jgi:hypothetical protein
MAGAEAQSSPILPLIGVLLLMAQIKKTLFALLTIRPSTSLVNDWML